jgi:hypothetical protein
MKNKVLRKQWLSATAVATAVLVGIQIYLTILGVTAGLPSPSFDMLLNNLGLTALAGMVMAIVIVLDTRKEN